MLEVGLDRLRKQRDQAVGLRDAGKLAEAATALRTYLIKAPNDREVALIYGDVLMRLERFDDAVKFYAKWIEKDTKDALMLSNLGAALLRQGKPADAKSILEYVLELDPKNIYARINLGGVYQSLGELNLALKNALEAVSIDPTRALTFNNLGSAFNDLAKFEEAKHAFETAVMLEPNQVDALVNLASAESKLGNSKEAFRRYEEVIRLLPKEAKHRREAIEFFASFEYLLNGDLENGWSYYEGGFSPLVPLAGARSPKRVFSVPRWRGENIKGKTLLV
jgi:tetratricopeptide (TPR) repeat protein